jgi:hypothetical protein
MGEIKEVEIGIQGLEEEGAGKSQWPQIERVPRVVLSERSEKKRV